MSLGFLPVTLARPTVSRVYTVRYLSRNVTDGELVEREAFAYWDNGYRKWSPPHITKERALRDRYIARTLAVQPHVISWKAIA